MYAELAIYQTPVRRTFHYTIPPELAIKVGQLVEVSFRTGLYQGIVVHLDHTSPVPNAKPILEVCLSEPVVTPTQIALARWMAETSFASLSACLWLMLPPGVARRGGMIYSLKTDAEPTPIKLNQAAASVVSLLRDRGPLRTAQIDRALSGVSWREGIRPLVAGGLITAEPFLPPPDARTQTVKTAALNVPADETHTILSHLRNYPKQAAVMELLTSRGEALTLEQITDETGASVDSIKRIAKKGWIKLGERERFRDPLAGKIYPKSEPPLLTMDQERVWARIHETMVASSPKHSHAFLVHGVTGSGKTEIYLRAIEQTLHQGRQVIVLVPEIALVAPTVGRFAARFPGRCAVVHSSLSDGEQYDTWRRAKAGTVGIIIGARSALFSPLPDPGLVIIDEEHDDSYKQSPPLPPPYYHARETAEKLMQITKGTLILGSATPDVRSVYRAEREEIISLRLPDRVIVTGISPEGTPQTSSAPLPPVQVIDMRAELREGNRSMFSRALRENLQRVLDVGEQAILFLNRRGHSTFILCRDCGYVARCPRCDIPLTYHQSHSGGDEKLVCHYCNFHSPAPVQCPECKSSRIRYLGAGTASLEQAVSQEFEGAVVARWDRDTASNRVAHEEIFERFEAGEANVLVGTQMIVKGLHLPRVTLVGVVLADTALGLPDYRAGERAFQLLTQAAGRAGRGVLGGRVIFQTYQPNHYALQAAALHDFESFYAREITYRRDLAYPPFKRLVRFLFRSPQAGAAQHEAEAAARQLREQITRLNLTATTLIGPTPAFFGKIDGVYQWHLLVRTTDPAHLLEGFEPKSGWIVDVDPVDIL
ncbi:MAG: primosomal protein N' [Anaerolineae bacterium]|nr:primosomal protein N' [Anaerolineae bacterium]